MNIFLWFCASVGGFLIYAVVAFLLACVLYYFTINDSSEDDFPMILCAIQSVAALFAIILYMEQFFNK